MNPVFKPRQELSEDALTEALKTCASEPIHIPGAIQPHGMMFVLDEDDQIVSVSDNAINGLSFPPDQVIGKNAAAFFGDKAFAKISGFIRENGFDPMRAVTITLRGKFFDAITHYSDPYTIIELEPVNHEDKARDQNYYLDLMRNQAHSQTRLGSTAEVYAHLVKTIRAITGFDRVKLYQFDDSWNGKVIAEDKRADIYSYLGMCFPASDIPEQARILYTKNHLRLIPDIQYKPSSLMPALQPSPDLSFSVLRSVSPIHIQYLDNMNIKASMSLSILQDGKLWGMVACHHNEPLYVPYAVRATCEVIGHTFSAKLASLLSQQKRARLEVQQEVIDAILDVVKDGKTVPQAMDMFKDILLTGMMADGLGIHIGGELKLVGETPSAETVHHLLKCRSPNAFNLVHSNDAAAWVAENCKKATGMTGGFMIMPITQDGADTLIWFRTAEVEKIAWAGKPEKNIEETRAGYRLTPRASFELWQQEVQTRAEPWSKTDIELARYALTRFLLRI